MEHANLYLLFPVYKEATEQPTYVKRVDILEKKDYENFLFLLQDMSSYFCYENYERFYDSRNLKAYLIPVDTLKDCYPKTSTLFRRKMNNWGVIGESLKQFLVVIFVRSSKKK